MKDKPGRTRLWGEKLVVDLRRRERTVSDRENVRGDQSGGSLGMLTSCTLSSALSCLHLYFI